MRRFAFTCVTGIAATAIFAAGFAEAATCYTLRAELEHLQSQGSGDSSRYDRAFQEQMNVLARTESRARTAGCFGSGFFLFRRQPERDCRTLVPKLREMQANLARLDRLRRRDGGGNPRRVRQIRAAMAERACGIPGRERRARVEERARDFDGYGRGTFRTLCVRTCDGYYFPISFSTRREQFGVDAQACAAMCPGAEARLFYHRNPGGGPEDMISLEEQRYSDLSTAFQYRTSLSPSCTCRPAGGYGRFAANPIGEVREEEPTEPAEFVALLPRPRSAPGEDPETLANRAGGFAPRAAAAGGVASSAATPGGSSIRVVGPAYPLAPEQAGVVLTPVPN